jgi:hypothetical protein
LLLLLITANLAPTFGRVDPPGSGPYVHAIAYGGKPSLCGMTILGLAELVIVFGTIISTAIGRDGQELSKIILAPLAVFASYPGLLSLKPTLVGGAGVETLFM